MPVALITGEVSADPVTSGIEAVAAALPDARIVSLEGQGHVADVLAPEMFAGRLIAWLRDWG